MQSWYIRGLGVRTPEPFIITRLSNANRRRHGLQRIAGNHARKEAVNKRSQFKTAMNGEEHWTKRDKAG